MIGNKQKVESALMACRFWMLGEDAPPQLLFWEWGPNPRGSKIDLVKCNGAPQVPQTDPQSFSNLFMTTFFEKGDFSVCKMLFRDVIVHLAALDFGYFVQTIVPRFLALDSDDPRFITFLMVVPKINMPITTHTQLHMRQKREGEGLMGSVSGNTRTYSGGSHTQPAPFGFHPISNMFLKVTGGCLSLNVYALEACWTKQTWL